MAEEKEEASLQEPPRPPPPGLAGATMGLNGPPPPPPPAFGQPPPSQAAQFSGQPRFVVQTFYTVPPNDDGAIFCNREYMERQMVEKQWHLEQLEVIMSRYGTGDVPAPACAICERQGCSKAHNFWNATSHIQSNRHLKCLPTWVPKGDAVNPFWQMFFHEGHKVYFNHVTLELKVL